MVSTVQKTLWN